MNNFIILQNFGEKFILDFRRYDLKLMDDKIISWILLWLSPHTYTGLFMMTIKKLLRTIPLEDIIQMDNENIYPEVYKNDTLSRKDINFIEDMRSREWSYIYSQIVRGEDIKWPVTSGYGEFMSMYFFKEPQCDDYYSWTQRYDHMITMSYYEMPLSMVDMIRSSYYREFLILNFFKEDMVIKWKLNFS